MTLMGQCAECEEHRRPGRPVERRVLTRGPDGRHLCSRHAREAWAEHDDLQKNTES